MPVFRTVLEQKIRERRQTFEEFAEDAEVFAREHDEPGTLSVRHLQRLAAGRGPGGRPLGPVRPATARLLENMIGTSIDILLGPPQAPAPVARTHTSGTDDALAPKEDPMQRRAALGVGIMTALSPQTLTSVLHDAAEEAVAFRHEANVSSIGTGTLDHIAAVAAELYGSYPGQPAVELFPVARAYRQRVAQLLGGKRTLE
jgi:hypothetical protein